MTVADSTPPPASPRSPQEDRAAVELLRPVLEMAFYMARSEASQRPPIEPPGVLRPYMKFRRLTGPALKAVRSALEDDADFRRRAADRARGDDELGPTAELFLGRPDGWVEAFESLVDEAVDEARASQTQDEVDSLRAALDRVERGRDALQQRVDSLLGDKKSGARALDEERRSRERAEAAVEALTVRIDELTERAVAAETRAQEAQVTLGEERRRLRELRSEFDELAAASPPSGAPAEPRAHAEPQAQAESRAEPGGEAAAHGRVAPAIDLAEVGVLLGRAAAATGELTDALQALAKLADDDHSVGGAGEAETGIGHPPRVPSRRRLRRRALSLPGLTEEDPAAATWLFRQSNAQVLVDGYNVTIRAWPDADLAVQRAHLLDLLTGEVTRSGADVLVVFDGDSREVAEALPPRCPVRVEFTPADLEADDRILDLLEMISPERPVIVVSSDNRVRDGARRLGANLVSSDQLLSVLRGG